MLGDVTNIFKILNKFRIGLDIGIFSKDDQDNEVELYLEKHKITSIHNKISIIVDKKPSEVGVDPYNKLIDTNSDDNRKKIEEVP